MQIKFLVAQHLISICFSYCITHIFRKVKYCYQSALRGKTCIFDNKVKKNQLYTSILKKFIRLKIKIIPSQKGNWTASLYFSMNFYHQVQSSEATTPKNTELIAFLCLNYACIRILSDNTQYNLICIIYLNKILSEVTWELYLE